ncbi:MAG: hypothetical protein GXO07_02065 [Crenarchaeota archaeon]|nr:hypothetical protein [Thermoproteota archaeon]
MRLFLLTLALAALASSATVSVWWELEGKPVTFLTKENYYLLNLCFKSDAPMKALISVRGDYITVPKFYETVASLGPEAACKKVLVYFDALPEVAEPDVAIKASEVRGIYVDMRIGNVKINKVAYLRLLEVADAGPFLCLEVKADPETLLPGSPFNATVTNVCDVPYIISAKVDVENAPDLTLKKALLRPGEAVRIDVAVPKFFGVAPVPGGPTVSLRGLYLSANGTAFYFVPVYDYVLYYVVPNAAAKWYLNGVPVQEVRAGDLVTACLELPKVTPVREVPPAPATLRAVEDLAFAPDRVVAQKGIILSKLPFKECLQFTAAKAWNTRGYKLELVVREDVRLFRGNVPLYASYSIGPELRVR